MAAGRHVALNPVRATLVERAWDWPHSSVRAHLAGRDGGLVTVRRSSPGRRASPIFSTRDADDPAFTALRRSELIGRPLGDDEFQGRDRPPPRSRRHAGQARTQDGCVAVMT